MGNDPDLIFEASVSYFFINMRLHKIFYVFAHTMSILKIHFCPKVTIKYIHFSQKVCHARNKGCHIFTYSIKDEKLLKRIYKGNGTDWERVK